MKNILYSDTDESGLDTIGPLWWRLNEHHKERSRHFTGHFARMTFDKRKQELSNKAADGNFRIDLAADGNTGEIVGFCASTVSAGKQGEIESIYVEQGYRRAGIGSNLIKRALDWMDTFSVNRKIVIVATGNEEAFTFYSRFGLFPAIITLRQINNGEENPP